MRFLDMKPKDIYCLFEITLSDLKKLKLALEHTTLDLDLSDPVQLEASEYITKELYPTVAEIVKDIGDGTESGIKTS